MKSISAVSRVVVCLVAVGIVARSPVAWGQALTAPPMPGTTTQLTTSENGQFNPSISGNIVCYTGLQTGQPNIYYVNVTAPVETPVTTDQTTYDELCDVSGSTIVYTHFPAVGSGVYGFTIGGTGTNPFAISDILGDEATTPGIGPPASNAAGTGPIVAWESNAYGNYDVYAEDLSTGVQQQLTANGSTGNSYTPNVWGRVVAYSTQTSTGCQVYVTNFDTLTTTQITNTTGCNQSTDISGNFVVYQGNRTGNANVQQVFVYNLATNTETEIPWGTYAQNPHISGNWVSFETVDLTSNGISIFLYNVATNKYYSAVLGSVNNSAFLNDIDGYNVAYTGNAGGTDHIYLFQFTPEISFASFTAVAVLFPPQGTFAVVGAFTLGAGGTVNLATNSMTLQVGSFSTTIPAGSFQLNAFGVYEYQGTINGVNVLAAIEPTSASTFKYVISGDGASGLPTSNPVNVGLTVGDNTGTESVKAVIL